MLAAQQLYITLYNCHLQSFFFWGLGHFSEFFLFPAYSLYHNPKFDFQNLPTGSHSSNGLNQLEDEDCLTQVRIFN